MQQRRRRRHVFEMVELNKAWYGEMPEIDITSLSPL
jgi:hypothetical protein